MKNFIVALIIFALTFSLVITNSFFINRIKDELLAVVSDIPSSFTTSDDGFINSKSNTRLLQTWNKYKNYVSLVSLYDYVYDIQSALDQMLELYDNGLYGEYFSQRKLFISAVKRLGESEEFSFTSVF